MALNLQSLFSTREDAAVRCSSTHQLCDLELEDCGRVPDPVGEVRNSAPEAGHRWQLLSCDDLMMDVG